MLKYFTKREKAALILLFVLFVVDFASAKLYSLYPEVDLAFHFLGGFFVAMFFLYVVNLHKMIVRT